MKRSRTALVGGVAAGLAALGAATHAAASELVGEPKYRGPETTLALGAKVAPKLANPLMRYKVSRIEHGKAVAVRMIRARKTTVRLHVGAYQSRGHRCSIRLDTAHQQRSASGQRSRAPSR